MSFQQFDVGEEGRLNPVWNLIHSLFFLAVVVAYLITDSHVLFDSLGPGSERVVIRAAVNEQGSLVGWLLAKRYQMYGQPSQYASVFGRTHNPRIYPISSRACCQQHELNPRHFEILVDVFVDQLEKG